MLINFASQPSDALLQSLQSALGADQMRVIGKQSARQLWRLHSKSFDVPTLLNALASFGEVQYAEPNYIISHTAAPNDPQFTNQWGLANSGQVVGSQAGRTGADIGAVAAWDVSRVPRRRSWRFSTAAWTTRIRT